MIVKLDFWRIHGMAEWHGFSHRFADSRTILGQIHGFSISFMDSDKDSRIFAQIHRFWQRFTDPRRDSRILAQIRGFSISFMDFDWQTFADSWTDSRILAQVHAFIFGSVFHFERHCVKFHSLLSWNVNGWNIENTSTIFYWPYRFRFNWNNVGSKAKRISAEVQPAWNHRQSPLILTDYQMIDV